ncbi:MAG: BatA domain-containing protein [Kiritimatiellia bacterium]
MSFVYPGVLYGLLLGAIPIIVYYLMRFRSLKVAWGADYILERALARQRRKVYWDQVILLALRALVVMALVVAFARPQSGKKKEFGGDGAVLRILLVDESYSMLAGKGGQTGREQASDAMRELVSRWSRGDKWSLYVMDSHPRWVVDQKAVVDPVHSRAILETLKNEEAAVSLAAGLKTVLAHGVGQRREIYIFSDDQATAWDGADQLTAPNDGRTRLFWFHPPLAERRNLGVTQLQASHERVLRGFPFPVYAQVANFSDEAVRDAELTFLVDGAMIGSKRVSLPPGQKTRVAMDLKIDTAGTHLITARLNNDVLSYDNAMSTGVEVADAISLLVLRDADRTGKFDSAAFFLKLAARIMAGNATNEAAGPLRVQELTTPACAVAQLEAHDAVLLDGGRTLTPELAETLRRYVERGGGLILAVDDTVDLVAWRRLLAPVGLLPVNPLRVRNEKLGEEICRRLSRSGFDLPALRNLETCPDGDVGQVRFYTWTEFDNPSPGTDVLARFGDGSPYVFQRRLERGSVMVLAAGLNSRNNNLLVRETMYPFLVHLFSESASSGQYKHSVGLHEPVRYLAKGEPQPENAMFEIEKEDLAAATLYPHARGMRVEYAPGASRSGPVSLLVLRDTSREKIWFGVQGERSDSSLTPMATAFQARLAETLGWTEVRSARELMDALESQGHGMERYAWVMLAVLLFALGELLMELRFL